MDNLGARDDSLSSGSGFWIYRGNQGEHTAASSGQCPSLSPCVTLPAYAVMGEHAAMNSGFFTQPNLSSAGRLRAVRRELSPPLAFALPRATFPCCGTHGHGIQCWLCSNLQVVVGLPTITGERDQPLPEFIPLSTGGKGKRQGEETDGPREKDYATRV